MGLPQPIAAALDNMEGEARTTAESLPAKARADFAPIEAEVKASLSHLEEATVAFVEVGNAWLQELMTAPAQVRDEVIDAAIESFRHHEERLAETVIPSIAAGQENLKEAFRAPRQLRAKLHRLSTRIIEVNAQAVEAVRDMRWKLLASRAAAEDPLFLPGSRSTRRSTAMASS